MYLSSFLSLARTPESPRPPCGRGAKFGVLSVVTSGQRGSTSYGERGDGRPNRPRHEIDDADYKVHGKTVVASHRGESNTYRWSVKGDTTLTLEWLDTTYGANRPSRRKFSRGLSI
jgi:hypothetical protein